VTYDTIGKEGTERAPQISHDQQTILRNDQIPFMEEAEFDNAWKTVAVMRGMGHPQGPLLSVKDVKEKFRVEFPELGAVGSTAEQNRNTDWERQHLLISDIDLVQRRHPELTRSEAKKWLEDRAEEQAAINDFKASRNLLILTPGNEQPREDETAAEAFGAMGPAVRDGDDEDA
jgi:hypothetical protein